MSRRATACGGLARTWVLLAFFCAAPGCPRRSGEDVSEGPASAPAAAPTEAMSPAPAGEVESADVPTPLETASADAADRPDETPGDLGTPPDWPETPLAPLRDLSSLERACRRKDWAACVALADRLADGPEAERDEARADETYARACEQGRRADACRRLGLRLLRLPSAPAAARAASPRLETACAAGYLDACETLGALLVVGERLPRNVYTGLEHLQRACNRGYAAACATTRGLREIAESYDLPLPRAVGPEPVEPGKEPPAEAVCPALFHGAAAVAFFERLDGDVVRLAPPALAAALPEAVEGWTVERAPVRDGDSFPRGTVVGARFLADDRSVELVVRDRLSECTLQPGTGAAMLERTGRDAEGRRTVRVDGADAVLFGPPDARALVLWVADRCEVRWTASGVPDERLLALARTLDLGTLRRECARRETADDRPIYE